MSDPSHAIYPEDVVVLKSSPAGAVGVVCCISEEGDDARPPMSAHVFWLRDQDNDRMEPLNSLTVVDRSLLNGDTVVLNGKHGLVTKVNVKVDIRFPNNSEVIKGVESRKLKYFQPYRHGNWVVHNDWLGRVMAFQEDVIVQFDDGSQCRVYSAPGVLLPADLAPEKLQNMPMSPLYPGQRVRTQHRGTFQGADWVKGAYSNQTVGTVINCNAGPGEVDVAWIVCLRGASPAPPNTFAGTKMTVLSRFEHTMVKLGDRVRFDRTVHNQDEGEGEGKGTEYSEMSGVMADDDDDQQQQNQEGEEVADGEVEGGGGLENASHEIVDERSLTGQIAGVHTTVDVAWQDGTQSLNLASLSMAMYNPSPHEFFQRDFVRERVAGAENASGTLLGTVVSSDADARMVVVNKFKDGKPSEDDPGMVLEQETMSAYELALDSDFTHRIGDVVIVLEEGETKPSLDSLGAGVLVGGHIGGGMGGPAMVDHVIDDIDDDDDAAQQDYQDNQENDDGDDDDNQQVDDDDEGNQQVDDDDEGDNQQEADGAGGGGDPASNVSARLQAHDKVGEVLLIERSGLISVAWASGRVSSISPHRLYRVAVEEVHDWQEPQPQPVSFGSLMSDIVSWATGRTPQQVAATETAQQPAPPPSFLQPRQYHLTIALGSRDFTFNIPNVPPLVAAVGGGIGYIGIFFLSSVFRVLSTTLTPLRFALGWWNRRQVTDGPTTPQTTPPSTTAPISSNAAASIEEVDETSPLLGEEAATASGGGSIEVADVDDDVDDSNAQVPTVEGGGGDGGGGDGGDTRVVDHAAAAAVETALNDLSVAFEPFAFLPSCPPDHKYLAETGKPSNPRAFLSQARKEWKLLTGGLPAGIFVRAYEDRTDCFRAAIVGPLGTPYQDGLFFFDIYLTPEYPTTPPLVHYHSHGDRLNPNLYECGKVCLSLLGTWAGNTVESWNPKSSSILQVLISIQGLILVPEPYFNEPTYDVQKTTMEGKHQARLYNESAMLLTLKSMISLVSRPPKDFLPLCQKHFLLRSSEIVQHCTRLLRPVDGSESKISKGCAIALERTLTKVTSAFDKSSLNSMTYAASTYIHTSGPAAQQPST